MEEPMQAPSGNQLITSRCSRARAGFANTYGTRPRRTEKLQFGGQAGIVSRTCKNEFLLFEGYVQHYSDFQDIYQACCQNTNQRRVRFI